MNVLYILNDGGMGGDTHSLLNMLVKLKNRIEPYVVIVANGQAENELKKIGVECEVVPMIQGYGLKETDTIENRNLFFEDNYKVALYLKKLIQTRNIDLIHINSSTSNAGAIAAVLSNKPFIWHMREIIKDVKNWEYWDLDFKKNLLQVSDGVISISKYAQKRVEELYGVKSFCLYNGIESQKCKFVADKDERDCFNILLASGVIEEKGIWDATLAVCELVNEYHLPIKLYVLGYQDEITAKYIKRYIRYKGLEKNIYLCKYVDNIDDYRAKCNISLTCSQGEALGRITIEAMLSGCFVIGSNKGATIELVGKNNERGILYEHGNPKSLVEAVLSVYNLDKEKKEKIIREAYNYAKKTFDTDSYADEIYNYYSGILNSPLKSELRENILLSLNEKIESIELNDATEKQNIEIKMDFSQDIGNICWHQMTSNTEFTDVLVRWLNANKYKRIAVYGAGRFGTYFLEAISDYDFDIVALYAEKVSCERYKDIYNWKSTIDESIDADLVVICMIDDTETIEKVKKYYSGALIGIKDLISIINSVKFKKE